MSLNYFYSLLLSNGKILKVGENKNKIYAVIKCSSGNNLILPTTVLPQVLEGVIKKNSGVFKCTDKSISLSYHFLFDASIISVVRNLLHYESILITASEAENILAHKEKILKSIQLYRSKGHASEEVSDAINIEGTSSLHTIEEVDEEL